MPIPALATERTQSAPAPTLWTDRFAQRTQRMGSSVIRELLKYTEKPDVIFSHHLEDRHQDHRLVGELTWQTWRRHLILEYEVPKYEGDLGQPNLFVPVSARTGRRKVEHLMRHFGSQRSRDWFAPPTFFGLMHLRGVECRAPSGFAEAHHLRKAVL